MICYYVFITVPVIPEFLSRPSQIQSFSSTTHPYDNSIISSDRKEFHPRVPREISNYECARLPSDFTYKPSWLVQDISVFCQSTPVTQLPAYTDVFCLASQHKYNLSLLLQQMITVGTAFVLWYNLQTIGEFPKEKWTFGIAMTATTNWSWSQTTVCFEG